MGSGLVWCLAKTVLFAKSSVSESKYLRSVLLNNDFQGKYSRYATRCPMSVMLLW